VDRVRRIELFVRAAEAGSFARAAKLLQLDPSAVSHAIAELERELRVTLFYRTTRQLRLTEDGEEILRRGRDILLEVAELESVAGTSDGRIAGTLRVGMHVPIGHVVMPRVPEFLRRQPGLKLECLALNQVKDMHAAGLDLLVRAGEPPESDLIGYWLDRRLCPPPAARPDPENSTARRRASRGGNRSCDFGVADVPPKSGCKTPLLSTTPTANVSGCGC
jgi:DNA-binding transcriptional LysR family regulator